MSDLDLAALRAIASKASPGDWQRGLWPDTFTINCSRYDICTVHDDADGRPLIGPEIALCAEEDANHIAAFDPPTALALLARIEQAEATLQTIVELDKQTELERQREHNRAVEAESERDRLREQVAAMREAMGEEWYPSTWAFGGGVCVECRGDKKHGHRGVCYRARFFAALASAEAAWR